MKKALSLILALMLCMSLSACDKDNQTNDFGNILGGSQDQSGGNNDQQGDQTVKEPPLVLDATFCGGKCLNVKRLHEIVEKVQLTTENWRDYIKVYTYAWDEIKTEKDAFGEVVSTETIKHEGIQLGAGNTRYHCFEGVAIELKNKTTGETTIFQFGYGGKGLQENIDLDAYECTRIQGCLYFVDIPEEAIVRSNSLVYFDMGMPMVNSTTGEVEDVSPYCPTTEIDLGTNAILMSYWSVSEVLKQYS